MSFHVRSGFALPLAPLNDREILSTILPCYWPFFLTWLMVCCACDLLAIEYLIVVHVMFLCKSTCFPTWLVLEA